jgi:hypothetical protein
MMTGVFPAVAFSKTADLVTTWVRAGGLVVLGEASIGYFSALSGGTLANAGVVGLGERGTERLIGKGVLQFPWVNQRAGEVESSFAAALGVTFKFTGARIQRNAVLSREGLVLGWYAGSSPSVAFILFLNAKEAIWYSVARSRTPLKTCRTISLRYCCPAPYQLQDRSRPE